MAARSCAILTIALLFALAALPGSVQAAEAELVISVAASLTDVAAELRPLFESSHPHIRLRFNFGSSGALQQQIARGAPVDVFISSAQEPMARLQEQGHVAPESVRRVAANRLVLIAPASVEAGSLNGWTGLNAETVRAVAVGNPAHVPAGMYARQMLESLGLWGPLQPKFVFAEDVRQALQYVRIGAVDAGVVYTTDAAVVQGVKVIAEAPAGSHAPIVYLLARMRSSRQPIQAEAFIEFLFTQEARAVFARHGFGDPE